MNKELCSDHNIHKLIFIIQSKLKLTSQHFLRLDNLWIHGVMDNWIKIKSTSYYITTNLTDFLIYSVIDGMNYLNLDFLTISSARLHLCTQMHSVAALSQPLLDFYHHLWSISHLQIFAAFLLSELFDCVQLSLFQKSQAWHDPHIHWRQYIHKKLPDIEEKSSLLDRSSRSHYCNQQKITVPCKLSQFIPNMAIRSTAKDLSRPSIHNLYISIAVHQSLL